MTRDNIVSDFESFIDEVGTSEFGGTVDSFINSAILSIFRKLMDPRRPDHAEARGYEKDTYMSEYISACKHHVEGTGANPGIITEAEIEALMPTGRLLSRISSFHIKFDTDGDYVQSPIKTSPEVAVSGGLRFYRSGKCRVFLERLSTGYKVHPSDVAPIFKGIAIAFPREVSDVQQEVDLDDFLRPAIVYHTAVLAGVSIRDSEYTREAVSLIQGIGL